MSASTQRVRRGLPRVPGGEPWPVVEGSAAAVPQATPSRPEATAEPGVENLPPALLDTAPVISDAREDEPSVVAPTVSRAPSGRPLAEVALRQGLPRTPGGEPWPSVAMAMVAMPEEPAPTSSGSAELAEAAPVAEPAPEAPSQPEPAQVAEAVPESATHAAPSVNPEAAPAPVSEPKLASEPASKAEPRLIRGRSLGRWVWMGIGILIGVIAAAGIIVLAARGVTTLPGVPEFLQRYPGEYAPRVAVDEGFPAWARWSHYLNFFFLVLVIRSGLLVRHQQQPPAFYTPKRGGKKVSIYLWLHTSIDVLWLLNGVVFVVLLFVTGHWARIVPTSWEVFPNAASALLQYLTLDWPVENGWVNYNSLQQLMYFIIVFIAAPLAAITGVRMSEWWPERTERLNRVYPVPLARAIHFPTMLFFALFVVIHVFLVLATGALRNLNHMFAGNDGLGWAGFWWFAAGLLATVAVAIAARPLVLAPIAGIAGRVSNR